MEKVGSNKVNPVQEKVEKNQATNEQERSPKQAEKKSRRLKKALATSAAICTEFEKKKQKMEGQKSLDGERVHVAEADTHHALLEKKRKQAEKKKRRIEKALATSAAICAELEKKKQKKLEEQRRLEEECAAIAVSVALHVLEEETDGFGHSKLKNENEFNHCDCSNGSHLSIGHQNSVKYSGEGLGWASDTCDPASWSRWELGCSLLPWAPVRDLFVKYTDISTELFAAQAVSSLKIAEDAHARSIQLVGPDRRTAGN